jgi:hypothetical protein
LVTFLPNHFMSYGNSYGGNILSKGKGLKSQQFIDKPACLPACLPTCPPARLPARPVKDV